MKVHIIVKTDEATGEFIKICGVYSDYNAAFVAKWLHEKENEKFCEKFDCDPDEFTIYTEEVE